MTPTMAKHIIASHLADCLLSHHDVQWEDWPDVGEHDWEDIDVMVRRMARQFVVSREEVDEAYRLLEERADHE